MFSALRCRLRYCETALTATLVRLYFALFAQASLRGMVNFAMLSLCPVPAPAALYGCVPSWVDSPACAILFGHSPERSPFSVTFFLDEPLLPARMLVSCHFTLISWETFLSLQGFLQPEQLSSQPSQKFRVLSPQISPIRLLFELQSYQ